MYILYRNMKPEGGFPACYIGGEKILSRSVLPHWPPSPNLHGFQRLPYVWAETWRFPVTSDISDTGVQKTLEDGSVLYIYIYQFPFNLQPPKTNGWNFKNSLWKVPAVSFREGWSVFTNAPLIHSRFEIEASGAAKAWHSRRGWWNLWG